MKKRIFIFILNVIQDFILSKCNSNSYAFKNFRNLPDKNHLIQLLNFIHAISTYYQKLTVFIPYLIELITTPHIIFFSQVHTML